MATPLLLVPPVRCGEGYNGLPRVRRLGRLSTLPSQTEQPGHPRRGLPTTARRILPEHHARPKMRCHGHQSALAHKSCMRGQGPDQGALPVNACDDKTQRAACPAQTHRSKVMRRSQHKHATRFSEQMNKLQVSSHPFLFLCLHPRCRHDDLPQPHSADARARPLPKAPRAAHGEVSPALIMAHSTDCADAAYCAAASCAASMRPQGRRPTSAPPYALQQRRRCRASRQGCQTAQLVYTWSCHARPTTCKTHWILQTAPFAAACTTLPLHPRLRHGAHVQAQIRPSNSAGGGNSTCAPTPAPAAQERTRETRVVSSAASSSSSRRRPFRLAEQNDQIRARACNRSSRAHVTPKGDQQTT